MLIELKKVHLRPLADGTIILEGYDNYGYHIERELNFQNVESADFTQDYLDVKFRNRKKAYRVWLKNIDFPKVVHPFVYCILKMVLPQLLVFTYFKMAAQGV